MLSLLDVGQSEGSPGSTQGGQDVLGGEGGGVARVVKVVKVARVAKILVFRINDFEFQF